MELAKEDAAWSAAESGRDVLMEVVFGNCGRIRFALASDSLRAVSPDVIVLDGLEGALSVVDRANEVIGRKCRE